MDLSKLTTKELRQLEQQIQEAKANRNDKEGWKVTMYIRFNPNNTSNLIGEKGKYNLVEVLKEYKEDFECGYMFNADVKLGEIVEATEDEINW